MQVDFRWWHLQPLVKDLVFLYQNRQQGAPTGTSAQKADTVMYTRRNLSISLTKKEVMSWSDCRITLANIDSQQYRSEYTVLSSLLYQICAFLLHLKLWFYSFSFSGGPSRILAVISDTFLTVLCTCHSHIFGQCLLELVWSWSASPAVAKSQDAAWASTVWWWVMTVGFCSLSCSERTLPF